jgi:hypothetical protein
MTQFRSIIVTLALLVGLGMIDHSARGISAEETSPGIVKLDANANCADIQKALDNLPAHGELLLAPGNYEISQPLMLRHNDVTLRGSGLTTVLHLANEANCPVVVLGPPMNQIKLPARNLCLADLLIDGNRSHQKVEMWRSAADGSEFMNNGVQVWNVNGATVEHVTCCRCRSGGLVTASVRNLKLNDFDSYDNQFDGLACYQTEQSHFTGLNLHDNLAAGISLDLSFNHNFIDNATLAGNDLGIFMRSSCDNSFQGLKICKSHHHGVFMAQAAAPTARGWILCPHTQCIGNNFADLVVSDCGGKAFQVNNLSCTNNAIFGATFMHNLLGGLGEPASNLITVRQMAAR